MLGCNSAVSKTEGTRAEGEAVAVIQRLGGDYCRTIRNGRAVITYVNLFERPCTDDDVQRLRILRELESLDLDASRITDRGMAHLQGLTRLERLNLGYTQVTDASLQ
jgi:hypothetical protein